MVTSRNDQPGSTAEESLESSNVDSVHLDRIIRNALDFLDKSIAEFDSAPKYALIHFYAAVELFLKARLFHEHWTLIVDSPTKASVSRLRKGDFNSVQLQEAISRLRNICESPLPKLSQECFDEIREHRNRVVHFHNSDAQQDQDLGQLKDHVAALICKGWFYLHNLIAVDWGAVFSQWERQIAEIEAQLRKQSKYLEAKWNEIRKDIEREAADGSQFISCPGCDLPAMSADQFPEPGTCLVCTLCQIVVPVRCPECRSQNFLVTEGVGECASCETPILPDHVWQTLVDSSHIDDLGDHMEETDLHGSCGECGGLETLIYLISGWFCTQCFVFWDDEEVRRCEWCLGYNSLLPDDSMLTGCLICTGHLGHMMEKDD